MDLPDILDTVLLNHPVLVLVFLTIIIMGPIFYIFSKY